MKTDSKRALAQEDNSMMIPVALIVASPISLRVANLRARQDPNEVRRTSRYHQFHGTVSIFRAVDVSDPSVNHIRSGIAMGQMSYGQVPGRVAEAASVV